MNQKIKFPRSEKVYLPGTLFPELRVAMRKVEQVPSTNSLMEKRYLLRIRKCMCMIPADRSATLPSKWI